MINNIPLTDDELKSVTNVPRHALDEFKRQIQRNPTRGECKYLGRWDPHQSIRQAAINPDGEPDTLFPIMIPDVWQGVNLYAELVLDQVPGPNFGLVKDFRSLRYHDGDDSAWPLRDAHGDLLRSNRGDLIASPVFRAPRQSVEPVTKSEWPQDVTNKGEFHVMTFLNLMWNYIGKRPPQHLKVDGPALNVPPKVVGDQDRRIAELEAQIAKLSRR